MPLPLVPIALGVTALGALGYAVFRKPEAPGSPGSPGAAPGTPGGGVAPALPGARPGMPPELRAAYQALLANGQDPAAMEQVASQLETYGYTAEAAQLRAKAAELRARNVPAPPVAPPPPPGLPAMPSFPLPSFPSVPVVTASVTGDGVRVRSTPSTSGAILTSLNRGASVTVLDMNAAGPDSAAPLGWAQVQSGSTTGYMSKQYLSLSGAAPAAPAPTTTSVQTASVTGDGVRIRSAPSTSGAILTSLNRGANVTVLNWSAAPSDSAAPLGWAQVQSGAAVGFMSKQYLSLNAPAPVAAGAMPSASFGSNGRPRPARCVAPSGCKLRQEPKPDARHFDIIPRDASVLVDHVVRLPKSDRRSPGKGGWALVSYAGKRGWVPSEWFV